MIGKCFEVYASEIPLANAVSFGIIGCLLKELTCFAVELRCEFGSSDILVIRHNDRDVRCNQAMKFRRISCAGFESASPIGREKQSHLDSH